MNYSWTEYHTQTKDKPPSRLLIEALQMISKKSAALDLGAGSLNDTKFLLKNGFEKVIAVDQTRPPEEILSSVKGSGFLFVQSKMEDYEFFENSCDLVSAQYSLPFCDANELPQIVKNIFLSLRSGGVFCGQLFGMEDSWNGSSRDIIFLSLDKVEELLSVFSSVKLDERKWDGTTAAGEEKHWHVYNFICRK